MIVKKNPSDAIVAAGVVSGVRQKIDSQVTWVDLLTTPGHKHEKICHVSASKYIILTCTHVCIYIQDVHCINCLLNLIRLLLRKCILPSHRKCLVTCLIELMCVSIFLHGNTVEKTIILSTWQILHTWIGGLPFQRLCCRL